MPDTKRFSSAKVQIVQAYEIVRQVHGEGTLVQRVAKFLGRQLDCHNDHSQIRRAIKEHVQEIRNGEGRRNSSN